MGGGVYLLAAARLLVSAQDAAADEPSASVSQQEGIIAGRGSSIHMPDGPVKVSEAGRCPQR